MNWYFEVWGKFAKFDGRANRSEYWFFLLFHIIVTSVLGSIDGLIGSKGVGPLFGLYGLASLIPSIAVSVRRLHDTNRSGWWLLLYFVPILGGLVLLAFFVMDSDTGHNQYGPNPKKMKNVKEDRQSATTERTASTDSTKEQDWYYSKETNEKPTETQPSDYNKQARSNYIKEHRNGNKGTEATKMHGFFKFIIIMTLVVISCLIGLSWYGSTVDTTELEWELENRQWKESNLPPLPKPRLKQQVTPAAPTKDVSQGRTVSPKVASAGDAEDKELDDFCTGIATVTVNFYSALTRDGETFDSIRDAYQANGRERGWQGYQYRMAYRSLLHASNQDSGRNYKELLAETYQSCMVTDDDNFLKLREIYHKHNPQ